MIDALRASRPHPDLGDRLELFGQFVGAWDVDVTMIGPDGTRTEMPGEWHFGWALDGRAVVDVFIVPRRSLRDTAGAGAYGVTVRFFDPSIDAWRCTWVGPTGGVVALFIARRTGDEITLSRLSPSHSTPTSAHLSPISVRRFGKILLRVTVCRPSFRFTHCYSGSWLTGTPLLRRSPPARRGECAR